MSSERIGLICFDLGGVLVRICHSWAQACEQAGVPMRLRADDPAIRGSIAALLNDYEVGQLHSDALVDQLVGLSEGHPAEEIHRIIDAWLIGLYDGVEELLGTIARAGVPTACLSNTNEWHWRLLMNEARFQGLGGLTHHFASHLIGRRKPTSAIYEHVERSLGMSERAIVFFDDLPENVVAANARGWRGYVIDPAEDTVKQIHERLMMLKIS